MENNLISEGLSGFNPGDSCVNLLLAITDEIFSIFDDNLLLPITDEIFSICDDNYEVRRGIL